MASMFDENRRIESPTKNVRLDWKSAQSSFTFYQKAEKEGEEGKTIKLEKIVFIPVFAAIRIGGFSEAEQSQIYSNTVEDSRTGILTVKYAKSNKQMVSGLYAQIKDTIKANKGEYQTVLYSVLLAANGKKLAQPKLVEVIISGSSSAGMSESHLSTFYILGSKISVTETLAMKKGGISYNAPKFVQEKRTDEDCNIELLKSFAQDVTDYLRQWNVPQKVEPVLAEPTPQLAPSTAYPEHPRTQSAMANYAPLVEDGSFPTSADEPKGDDTPEDGLPF